MVLPDLLTVLPADCPGRWHGITVGSAARGAIFPVLMATATWRPWTGERKKETREHPLFLFLTTEANDVVRPIHAKAMPVILTMPAEFDAWLLTEADEALKLQRPLPAEQLSVVAKEERKDLVAN